MRQQVRQRRLGSYVSPSDPINGLWLEVFHDKPRSSSRGYVCAVWHQGTGETHRIVQRRRWPTGNTPTGDLLSHADLVRFAQGLRAPQVK